MIETQIPSGANYLNKPMIEVKEKKKKPKRYRMNMLRKTLERRMQEYWCDPTIKVTPMDFSRMLKCYCEIFEVPEEVMRAKELDESFVDEFGTWLGYPLR